MLLCAYFISLQAQPVLPSRCRVSSPAPTENDNSSVTLYEQLIKISKRSIRILWGLDVDAHTAPLFSKLNLYPQALAVRFNLKLFVLVHRAVHGMCSPLLKKCFSCRTPAGTATRGCSTFSLTLPAVSTRTGLFALTFLAADRWNSLPSVIRALHHPHKFRQACLAELGYPARSTAT